MGKHVVLVTRKYSAAVEMRLERDYQARLNPDDTILDLASLMKAADGTEAILMTASEPLNAEAVMGLPATVKIVANFGAGYDQIDLDAAASRGLVVTNTPDAVTAPTADLAMLLILGVARRGHEMQTILREGQWGAWSPTWMLGRDVTGKRLGIVGMGRIGQAVARRARGFDMEVHYHNRNRLSPEKEAGAVYHTQPETLLRISEFLSLHFPATPQTKLWLNEDRIALLPDGAFVINAARGSLVDEDALIAALKSGKLGGAGLDVFQSEPDVRPDLVSLENTFLLPHIGSGTVEGRDAMGFQCLDNLDAFFAGREPPNRVA